jgi:class 3 adenylate cyclase
VRRPPAQLESEHRSYGGASEIRTFLIGDVRGYTRFSEDHGDAAAARLTAKFAEIAAEAVEAHDGEVVALRGDEVLAVFFSSRSAVRAAVELQEVLADEAAAEPTLPVLAGIGLGRRPFWAPSKSHLTRVPRES